MFALFFEITWTWHTLTLSDSFKLIDKTTSQFLGAIFPIILKIPLKEFVQAVSTYWVIPSPSYCSFLFLFLRKCSSNTWKSKFTYHMVLLTHLEQHNLAWMLWAKYPLYILSLFFSMYLLIRVTTNQFLSYDCSIFFFYNFCSLYWKIHTRTIESTMESVICALQVVCSLFWLTSILRDVSCLCKAGE